MTNPQENNKLSVESLAKKILEDFNDPLNEDFDRTILASSYLDSKKDYPELYVKKIEDFILVHYPRGIKSLTEAFSNYLP